MNESLIIGVVLGVLVEAALSALVAWNRERHLFMIGRTGGCAVICGQAFRIAPCETVCMGECHGQG